jgi:hypothetical protein
MVSSIYAGRLGNILFEKAAAIGYAQKHGLQYCIDEEPSIRHMWPKPVIIKESGHQYQELPFMPQWKDKHVVLQGFWQSERYFAHCREEVLKAFGFSWEPLNAVCSIHVRRGDYLLYPDKHPVVTAEYLDQAISYICQNTGVSLFMVFSDDIPYCRQLINSRMYYGCRFDYSERIDERRDLEFMSRCEHNIISNSTFSWWGAWLNQNPDKVVISPSKDNWFGPGNAHLDTSDIIPESWIQIKY